MGIQVLTKCLAMNPEQKFQQMVGSTEYHGYRILSNFLINNGEPTLIDVQFLNGFFCSFVYNY